MIRVIHKQPGMPAEVVMIEDSLPAFQKLLNDGFLCFVRLSADVHAYVDDEGLLKKLPLNFILRGEPIVGPAVFSKLDGGLDIGFENEKEALTLCQVLNTGKC